MQFQIDSINFECTIPLQQEFPKGTEFVDHQLF